MHILGNTRNKELHNRPYRGQPVEWREENALNALAALEPYLLHVARVDKHVEYSKNPEQHTYPRDAACSRNDDIGQPVRITY
ncbi:hypothetical protein PHABIO_300 [Pseudomonas phage Phabio]|uniref:Uncharacterized protein n=1 Tax=Pseudomonas phage Phabio TaxID=2006668 RepID=A0A1Y0STV5_9CAUD|nr:hypothetical protein MZD05_gp300 [Pseudomonas phage Phabio]ARV76931.1 hypothetical protein PHABIO_300 [Pseudomonas phage Phabio]